jgi:uncharacterized protein YbaP (TraB family)
MKRMLLVAMLLVFPLENLNAESMIWKVEKGSEVVYIGGTIHVLRESDYPLPEEFLNAFANADILVLEADMGQLKSLEVQQKIMAGATYPPGEGLDQVLSKEAYDALAEYCQQNGLPIVALNQFKPSLVSLTILGLEMQKLGLSVEFGIDIYFYQRAVSEGKGLIYIETIDEQIAYILAMGEGRESEYILKGLSDLHKMPEDLEDMIQYWKTGDDDKMEDLILAEVMEEYPEIYESLIKERNELWLPEIEALFLTEEDELVLVGAGHLIGEEGIITMLKERGYSVEKF